MEIFLSQVAKDLLKRYGTDLTKLVVVFPSRRARLFFDTCLYNEIQKPIFAPTYYSVDELFERYSSFRKADTIQLIGELYNAYLKVYNAHSETLSAETLDEFYSFGEILLNDFDDIDKNLVDVNLLFHNLKELDELKDNFSHLTENQREALSRFGKLFEKSSYLKDSFLSVWNLLGEVYKTFKNRLTEQYIAYPGMLMRDVAESKIEQESGKIHVFVGFNVLNKCEERLLLKLKNDSLFYWDYDPHYIKQESGRFIKRNIALFGSALEQSDIDSKPKEIEIISSPSESAQSGIIEPWIRSLKKKPDFTQPDSAIILCNESILPVIMHAIPSDKVENVNITMGFPLTQTPVAGFLQTLADMQLKGISGQKFLYKYVLSVLRHPFVRSMYPEANQIEQTIIKEHIFFPEQSDLNHLPVFKKTSSTTELAEYLLEQIKSLGEYYSDETSDDVYNGLYQESIFQAYQLVNRLYGLLKSEQWTLEKATFVRLLKKLIASVKIPFHGEPIKGLQVMGLLETRTLDFKHILMLSVNEGFMPGSESENTFIPQFLRKHFDLNTYEHQDAIYSYYFYRLIQRAEKLTFVYNINKTGIGKAEISRFLLQLLVEKGKEINRFSLNAPAIPWRSALIEIPKTPLLLDEIRKKYDYHTNPQAHALTPSALNVFIDCPLRFYWQKIKGFQQEEELLEEMDSSVFGTIFHHAAEYLYQELGRVGKTVRREDLELYLLPENEYLIRKLVAKAFDEDYFKRKVDESQYNGEQLINFNVICEMLARLIRFDSKNTPFDVLGLEWKTYDFFEIPAQNLKLQIGGIVDRLDKKGENVRILDYKTGGKSKSFKELSDLFSAKKDRAAHIFQTFLYASVLIRKNEFHGAAIAPALLYIQEAGKEDYSPAITYKSEAIEDFSGLHEEFEDLLIRKIEELFHPEIPFTQTADSELCKYCDFREICNR